MEKGLLPLVDDQNIEPPPPPSQPMNFPVEDDNISSSPIEHNDYQPPVYMPMVDNRSKDIFADMDKSTCIIIFVVFILGFFMGKTMQPVIIRPT